MKAVEANLRVSYIGGGYDFPKFFAHTPVSIISEGLPLAIRYDGTLWQSPVECYSGLGGSAARHFSYLRYHFRDANFKSLVDVAIAMDGLQNGGWQDAIASAHDGFMKLTLYQEAWEVSPLDIELGQYRRLYKIPTLHKKKNILQAMQCRESSFEKMQKLVKHAEDALTYSDYYVFGNCVKAAWSIKKQWHPDISNATIVEMERIADAAQAWGYKVCGAGGQGYFLVVGDIACHQAMKQHYKEFEVNG